METALSLAAWAGIFASLLGLALTVYGVFYNGRATRRVVEAIHEDIRAIHADGERRQQELLAQGERHHQGLAAYLRDMDRRHTEILAEIGKRL